nr:hypothetical protein [uncultured Methanoregula sp.]
MTADPGCGKKLQHAALRALIFFIRTGAHWTKKRELSDDDRRPVLQG